MGPPHGERRGASDGGGRGRRDGPSRKGSSTGKAVGGQRKSDDRRGSDQRDRREARGEPSDPRPQPSARAPKKWGSLARKGTRWLTDDPGTASGAWRKAIEDARETERLSRPVEAPTEEIWVRDDEDEPEDRQAAPSRTQPRSPKLPDEVAAELAAQSDARARERNLRRLSDAIRAYERDRYQDALRLLKPIVDQAPDVAAARELYGLTLYRLGRWAAAVKQLRAYFELTGSYDQHPTLMDAYRAQKRWPTVERLWAELKEASPSGAVVAEGRIVMAGALADRGQLKAAIDLLERSKPVVKNPKDHHLRTMYALADLYDRAGDIPRARDLFRRLADTDPDYFDVRSRLRSL